MVEILGTSVEPGTRFLGSFEVGEMVDGRKIESPIAVISGRHPGPILFASGAVHGDEILGPLVIRRVINELSPDQLHGTFIATPIVNSPCFATRSRIDPADFPSFQQDLNRVFPGRPDGTLTQRIAYKLLNEVITKAQYCIDIHSSGQGGLWAPYAHILPEKEFKDPETYRKTLEMAGAFGTTFVVRNYSLAGSLIWAAAGRGVPALITEFGPVLRFDRTAVEIGVRGLTNVMKMLGMISGEIARPGMHVQIRELIVVNANRSGFLDKRVTAGDKVSSGEVLAEVSDWTGKVVETITAPADSYVLRIADYGTIRIGDRFANLGIPE